MTFGNFIIRPIVTGDAPEYFSFIERNRGRLERYFPNTVHSTSDLSATEAHLNERMDLAEKGEFIMLVLEEKGFKQIIGAVFIKEFDWSIRKAELGFFIDKDYEQKGIATQGIALVCDHCFDTMRMNKLFMRIEESNLPSRRVAEKNGFIAEGILRSEFKTGNGFLIDLMYYGRLRAKAAL
jgi:ribosomal-protein-serine acetyltransferase